MREIGDFSVYVYSQNSSMKRANEHSRPFIDKQATLLTPDSDYYIWTWLAMIPNLNEKNVEPWPCLQSTICPTRGSKCSLHSIINKIIHKTRQLVAPSAINFPIISLLGHGFNYPVAINYINIFFPSNLRKTVDEIHTQNILFFLWCCDPTRVMTSSFLRFLDHTR
jgi:hypothetical protein